MDLSLAQHRAARACGFTFFPATEVQVQRLTMQRRIFRVNGQPCLATRDGAYWETHGTLLRLIEDHRPAAPVSNNDTPDEAVEVRAARPDSEPPAPPAGGAEAAAAQRDGTEAPPPKPRGRTARRPKAGPSSGSETAADCVAAKPPPEEDREVAGEEGPLEPAVQRRRAGQPKTPRWMVAGKLRRGRLK